jgi:phosphinothricin acetyltransferase
LLTTAKGGGWPGAGAGTGALAKGDEAALAGPATGSATRGWPDGTAAEAAADTGAGRALAAVAAAPPPGVAQPDSAISAATASALRNAAGQGTRAGTNFMRRGLENQRASLPLPLPVTSPISTDMPSQIRLVRLEDAARIAEIYAPYVTERPTSFEMVPPDASEIAARITKTVKRWPWLVWVDEQGVQGYAYAGAHSERICYQWSVGVSVYVSPRVQRQGVGRQLYARLFDILRRQGFYNAYGGITEPNPGSIGLHEAMGFQRIGLHRNVGYKLGAWHDVATLGLALRTPQPGDAAPTPPRDLPEMLAAGELPDLAR